MGNDFLLKSRDEKVLDNYLQLLAFTAQERNSEHVLLSLKLENNDLKQKLNKSLSKVESAKDAIKDLNAAGLPIHALKTISYLERLLR